MAFIHSGHLGWHEGEQQMHSILCVPYQENPTSPFLTPGAAHMLQTSPLLALGALDDQGRPWTTVWGGEPGFARSIGQSVVGVKTLVDRLHDPVVGALVGGKDDGEVSLERVGGKMVSGLAIDLATRRRAKLFARMVGGAMDRLDSDGQDEDMETGQIQLVMKVEQSLGNCPKYLNKKQITPASPKPTLISDSTRLPDEAIDLLTKSDLFFMSSSNQDLDMDTNSRGGAPGFVRVVRNDASGAVLAYPEYSGNRFYQTLGNLQTNPRTGLVFPDFETGDVLYITGTTEVLVGKQAAALLPRSNLAVKFNVTAARFVREGLAFRGKLDERSPYNPPVRLLATERALPDAQSYSENAVYATLVKKDILTPTIARFRFSVSDPVAAGRWKPGQYVALAFEAELGMGYSHMRDDNPKSLNDDYTRTFTVSSVMGYGLPEDEFEITIRKVGVVTDFLFRQNVRARLEIPLKGFGGEFAVRQDEGETVPFVAGGIGITPVLSQLSSLDLKRLRLLWTVNIRDVGLVSDTFKRCPQLATSTTVFVSGIDNGNAHDEETVAAIEYSGAHVLGRRMLAEDVLTLKQSESTLASRWYICTGTALRKSLLEWLPGKEVIYEDFNY